jgi:rSAM/selenodomain-associated transferase 1
LNHSQSRAPGSARLIVFARTPQLGRVKTRLGPAVAPGAALRLHRAFIQDTLRLVLQVMPPGQVTVAFSAEPAPQLLPLGVQVARQSEGDLGQRLSEAAHAAWTAGASRILFLGTDSPDLPAHQLVRALQCLESADAVVGPAEDGGYYLIGLQGAHVGLFHGIDWGTDRVLAQTRARAAALGLHLMELDAWYDVDRPEDLRRLAAAIDERRALQQPVPEMTARVLVELGYCRGAGTAHGTS